MCQNIRWPRPTPPARTAAMTGHGGERQDAVSRQERPGEGAGSDASASCLPQSNSSLTSTCAGVVRPPAHLDLVTAPPLALTPGGLTTRKIQTSDWRFSIGKEAAGTPRATETWRGRHRRHRGALKICTAKISAKSTSFLRSRAALGRVESHPTTTRRESTSQGCERTEQNVK